MKIDGYKFLSEFFSSHPGEKKIKSFPFVSVEIYHGHELVTKKKLIARLSITDKRVVIDGLSSFTIFPIVIPRSRKHFDVQDIRVMYKKVKEVAIPYEYLLSAVYDKKLEALKITTLLDHNYILVKGPNIEKRSDEIINIIEPFVKHYAKLR